MEGNFAARLKLFLDHTQIPSTQFADLCEIPRPSFSQLLSGRNQKISDTLVRKIHAAFPELSIMWLMFGEGTMLQSNDSTKEERPAALENRKNKAEILEMQTSGAKKDENANLKGLTAPSDNSKDTIIQQLEENKKIVELQMQIEKMQKNARRVTQITVYYDDSTFETFVPSK